MPELDVLSGARGLEQVAVMRGLLHGSSSDRVSLFKQLFRRSPLLNQAGDPGLGT